MRNKKLLRYGLASTVMTFGALGAFLVACGDDDSGVTANQPDGSTTDTGGGGDTGGGDGGGDTGTDSAAPVPAKIVIVHAATDYGPNNPTGIVRVCYATKTASDPDFGVSPLDPLPHSKAPDSTLPYPGIPIGAGGPFPSTGLPLEGFAIRPYIISAAALNERGVTGKAPTTPKCNQLLRPGGFVPDGGFPDAGDAGALEENKDYWVLSDIPLGTFKNGKTYILSVTGCTSDTDGNTFLAKCGPDPANANQLYSPPGTPGKGNLTIAVLEIDATTTVAADEMGVQLAHLSPQYEAARNAPADAGAGLAYRPLFGNPDAGDAGHVPAAANEIHFSNSTVSPVAKLKGIVTQNGYFAANSDDPIAVGEQPFIPITLNNSGGVDPANGVFTIQYISEGKTVPNTAQLYVNGKSYTFVLVGDPTLPAQAGLRRVHYLGFPNVFEPPKTSD